jgi:hypothetical protein
MRKNKPLGFLLTLLGPPFLWIQKLGVSIQVLDTIALYLSRQGPPSRQAGRQADRHTRRLMPVGSLLQAFAYLQNLAAVAYFSVFRYRWSPNENAST